MEEQDLTPSEGEEVEGHQLSERPLADSPQVEAASEEPDVEGHGLVERISSEEQALSE